MEMWVKDIRRVVGVDFSGAAKAGENVWLATVELGGRGEEGCVGGLVELVRLADVAGTAEREPALGALQEMIVESGGGKTLWAMDFPFGLPVELFEDGTKWEGMLEAVGEWKESASDFGRWCVKRAVEKCGKMHVRRETDVAVRTPFDCYHYRIIHQTFWGMRMLRQLRRMKGVAVVPFDYGRAAGASAVVAEGCPGSTLRRLGWPYNNYKQPTGGKLTSKRLTTRRKIMEGIVSKLRVSEEQYRVMMRNPGGDAMDAVLAAMGAGETFGLSDHAAIRQNKRWVREGWVYC